MVEEGELVQIQCILIFFMIKIFEIMRCCLKYEVLKKKKKNLIEYFVISLFNSKFFSKY